MSSRAHDAVVVHEGIEVEGRALVVGHLLLHRRQCVGVVERVSIELRIGFQVEVDGRRAVVDGAHMRREVGRPFSSLDINHCKPNNTQQVNTNYDNVV